MVNSNFSVNNNDLSKLKIFKYDSNQHKYIDFLNDDSLTNYVSFNINNSGQFESININKTLSGLNYINNVPLSTAPNSLLSALDFLVIKKNLGNENYSDESYLLDNIPDYDNSNTVVYDVNNLNTNDKLHVIIKNNSINCKCIISR